MSRAATARRPAGSARLARLVIGSSSGDSVRASYASVTHSSGAGTLTGNRNRGGITPTMLKRRPLSLMSRPTTAGSASNCERHNWSLMTATSAPARSSSSWKPRPSTGWTPSVEKNSDETTAPSMCSDRVPDVSVKSASRYADNDSTPWARERQSKKFGHDTDVERMPGARRRSVSVTATRRSGWGNGNGRSRTALMTLNIAVFAPMPSASVMMATRLKPGDLRSVRQA